MAENNSNNNNNPFVIDNNKFINKFAKSLLANYHGDTYLARQVAIATNNKHVATHVIRAREHFRDTNGPEPTLVATGHMAISLGYLFGADQMFYAVAIGEPHLLFGTADDIRHLFRLDYTPYTFHTVVQNKKIQYCRITWLMHGSLVTNLAERGPELFVIAEPGCGGPFGELGLRMQVTTPMRMLPPAERTEWIYGEPRERA